MILINLGIAGANLAEISIQIYILFLQGLNNSFNEKINCWSSYSLSLHHMKVKLHLARLAHATAAVAALRRGARLIVVDPRRVGLASKADLWLRVRPGSDGARARNRQPPDRARPVRSRLRPRLDERPVARSLGQRPISDRVRPLACREPRAVRRLSWFSPRTSPGVTIREVPVTERLLARLAGTRQR